MVRKKKEKKVFIPNNKVKAIKSILADEGKFIGKEGVVSHIQLNISNLPIKVVFENGFGCWFNECELELVE